VVSPAPTYEVPLKTMSVVEDTMASHFDDEFVDEFVDEFADDSVLNPSLFQDREAKPDELTGLTEATDHVETEHSLDERLAQATVSLNKNGRREVLSDSHRYSGYYSTRNATFRTPSVNDNSPLAQGAMFRFMADNHANFLLNRDHTAANDTGTATCSFSGIDFANTFEPETHSQLNSLSSDELAGTLDSQLFSLPTDGVTGVDKAFFETFPYFPDATENAPLYTSVHSQYSGSPSHRATEFATFRKRAVCIPPNNWLT